MSVDHVDLEGLVFLGGVGQFIALDLILRGMCELLGIPCHQGQLYPALQVRCRACSPKSCSW